MNPYKMPAASKANLKRPVCSMGGIHILKTTYCRNIWHFNLNPDNFNLLSQKGTSVKYYNLIYAMMPSLTFWPFSPHLPSNGHNQKVHMHMVDLMSSIICEGDTVSQELLDTVLVNLVPAHKVCVDARVHNCTSTNGSVTYSLKWVDIVSRLRPISLSIPCNSMRPLQVRRGKAAW